MKITIDVPEGYFVQVVKEEDSSRAVTPEWLAETKHKFPGINVDRELEKAKVWAGQHRRRVTRAFLVNWLNRLDPCFYKDSARADILKRVEEIKARGHADSMGVLRLGAADEAMLEQLREEYRKL